MPDLRMHSSPVPNLHYHPHSQDIHPHQTLIVPNAMQIPVARTMGQPVPHAPGAPSALVAPSVTPIAMQSHLSICGFIGCDCACNAGVSSQNFHAPFTMRGPPPPGAQSLLPGAQPHAATVTAPMPSNAPPPFYGVPPGYSYGPPLSYTATPQPPPPPPPYHNLVQVNVMEQSFAHHAAAAAAAQAPGASPPQAPTQSHVSQGLMSSPVVPATPQVVPAAASTHSSPLLATNAPSASAYDVYASPQAAEAASAQTAAAAPNVVYTTGSGQTVDGHTNGNANGGSGNGQRFSGHLWTTDIGQGRSAPGNMFTMYNQTTHYHHHHGVATAGGEHGNANRRSCSREGVGRTVSSVTNGEDGRAKAWENAAGASTALDATTGCSGVDGNRDQTEYDGVGEHSRTAVIVKDGPRDATDAGQSDIVETGKDGKDGHEKNRDARTPLENGKRPTNGMGIGEASNSGELEPTADHNDYATKDDKARNGVITNGSVKRSWNSKRVRSDNGDCFAETAALLDGGKGECKDGITIRKGECNDESREPKKNAEKCDTENRRSVDGGGTGKRNGLVEVRSHGRYNGKRPRNGLGEMSRSRDKGKWEGNFIKAGGRVDVSNGRNVDMNDGEVRDISPTTDGNESPDARATSNKGSSKEHTNGDGHGSGSGSGSGSGEFENRNKDDGTAKRRRRNYESVDPPSPMGNGMKRGGGGNSSRRKRSKWEAMNGHHHKGNGVIGNSETGGGGTANGGSGANRTSNATCTGAGTGRNGGRDALGGDNSGTGVGGEGNKVVSGSCSGDGNINGVDRSGGTNAVGGDCGTGTSGGGGGGNGTATAGSACMKTRARRYDQMVHNCVSLGCAQWCTDKNLRVTVAVGPKALLGIAGVGSIGHHVLEGSHETVTVDSATDMRKRYANALKGQRMEWIAANSRKRLLFVMTPFRRRGGDIFGVSGIVMELSQRLDFAK